VTSLFKRLFKIHYESRKEIEQAPEWQELIKLFCNACDTYVNIAMANRRKIRGDLLVWVKAQIEEDENAISKQHFKCDRNGYFAREDASKGSLDDHQDAWCAQEHMGWMNLNAVWSVYRDNMERAASVALGNAAIRIASGSANPLHPAQQDTSANRGMSQVQSLPTYLVLLSTFEVRVGKLMVQARRACPTKYLPQAEIAKIAALLDDEKFPVRSNLEREAARTMAEHNQRHPTAAIKSWRTALSHPLFRRAVRKRFSRAEEKYKKATPSVAVVSAGSPRTAI
jgi:hypothetical protein